MIGGGAPAGSVVLLAGDSGGVPGVLLHQRGDERARGDRLRAVRPPLRGPRTGNDGSGEVHYVSFTDGREAVVDEMSVVIDDEIVEEE